MFWSSTAVARLTKFSIPTGFRTKFSTVLLYARKSWELALSTKIKQEYQNGDFQTKLRVPTAEGRNLFFIPGQIKFRQPFQYNFKNLYRNLSEFLITKFTAC